MNPGRSNIYSIVFEIDVFTSLCSKYCNWYVQNAKTHFLKTTNMSTWLSEWFSSIIPYYMQNASF